MNQDIFLVGRGMNGKLRPFQLGYNSLHAWPEVEIPLIILIEELLMVDELECWKTIEINTI